MWKSVLTLVAVLAVASPSIAQNYPQPTKVGTAQSICVECKSLNSVGEPNLDKPTWQFDDPLSAFAGRVVDSQGTQNIQHQGHRTLRAGLVRTAYSARGSAPARVYAYIGLGTFGAYSLDTFATTLKNPMVTVVTVNGGPVALRNKKPETVAKPDAIVYPEAPRSGWQVPFVDSTERLKDFDFDDRGYVYLAYDIFGWAIVKDSGETGIATLPIVQGSQQVNDMQPDKIISIKSNNKYYVATSWSRSTLLGRQIWDVTDPKAPDLVGQTSGANGKTTVIKEWAKDDNAKVVAVIAADGILRIYGYDAYVRNDAPMEMVEGTRDFVSVSFDDKGVLWAIEPPASNSGATKVHRFTPSAGGYTETILTPFPEWFDPVKIHARNGYVAAVGMVKRGPNSRPNGFIFKVDTNGLTNLDTGDFFLKYYHAAPSGFAQPEGYTSSPQDIHILKMGTKVYLMYMVYGLGDVFQLEGSGPSLSTAIRSTTFGTPNPHSQGTEDGPFPGDPISFRATISNATGVHPIGWNFGNPEDTAGNAKGGSTGVDITHQFTGLNNLTKVTTPKTVTATLASDASVSDSATVELSVPTPRIAIESTEDLMTEAGFAVLPEDKFVDASDGSIEGHFATWKIDNTTTKLTPDKPIEVGDLGPHTVELTASYGKYDEDDFSTTGTPFAVKVASLAYDVLPFLARLNPVTRNGATVTYSATGRATDDLTILTATQWTFKWTLTSKGGTEKELLTGTANIPTIPPFAFNKAELANEDVVRLELSVLPAGLPGADQFATFAVETEVALPDPVIQLTSCGFVNDLCSIKAVSASGNSTAGWNLSWTVKQGQTTIKSGTGNPLETFKLNNEGSHTVSVHDTVFDTTPVSKTFTVEPSQCGPPPNIAQIAISQDCDGCDPGDEVTFRAVPFHYVIQDCDQIIWNFDDGTPNATGEVVKHTFTSNKTYNVKLTIKNPTDTTGTTITEQVKVGNGTTPPPPPTCTAPTNIDFVWSASGCGSTSGVNCKSNQTVSFQGKRGTGNLQSCDTTAWTFDGAGSSDKTPTRTFTAGNHTVTLKVTNEKGSSNTVTKTITIDQATGNTNCNGSATVANVSFGFRGQTSGCTKSNGIICQRGETIDFTTSFFNYTPQSCDRYDFSFDDGTNANGGTSATISRVLAGTKNTYNVSVKVYNSNNTSGVTASAQVPFSNIPVLQPPVLTTSFPTDGTKGVPMTFTVTADRQATGWRWEFEGVPDLSKQNDVGLSSTITHTFTTAGRKTVRVFARNAADTSPNAPTSNKLVSVDIEEAAEARFLLPIVGHAPGQAGSNWRTDVQFYSSNVSPTNPLVMQASFMGGAPKELRITDSTLIYSDFMTFFTNENAIGPVIISAPAERAPQIWTRTYNQSDTGTFGQFIPAIRLDEQGGGAAIGSGMYYLPGLRHDDRYRTNIGFVNPSAQVLNATIRVYDEDRHPIAQFAKALPPLQIVQFTLANEIDSLPGDASLPNDRSFYLEIQVPDGQWVIGYASYIDSWSNDPLFVQALRETEVSSADFGTIVVPGVGHTGQWRSDITLFNPDRNPVSFDLAYYDGAGVKRGEAKSVVLDSLKSLQYRDIITQGVLGGPIPDGAGILEIRTLTSPIPNTLYPMAFSRTYFDQPGQGTYGQAINGVARARANVKLGKPALIPGVRFDENYYTNIGITNLSDAPAAVTITLLNPQTGEVARQETHTIQPNESRIGGFDFGGLTQGAVRIETASGNVWAFASVIDRRTKDPEYVAATPLP